MQSSLPLGRRDASEPLRTYVGMLKIGQVLVRAFRGLTIDLKAPVDTPYFDLSCVPGLWATILPTVVELLRLDSLRICLFEHVCGG